ncbi:hypothetical protein Pcinc_044344, partial [Petrolisthes cinctipes]
MTGSTVEGEASVLFVGGILSLTGEVEGL